MGWGRLGSWSQVIPSIRTQVEVMLSPMSYRNTQSTGYSKTVVGGLVPHTSLLVPLTGSTGPVVHLYSLTESAGSHL